MKYLRKRARTKVTRWKVLFFYLLNWVLSTGICLLLKFFTCSTLFIPHLKLLLLSVDIQRTDFSYGFSVHAHDV